MIAGKKILAIIPARGGSKGLPGKNIKVINGKPMIAHSIEKAFAVPGIDRLIVSTDDEDIAKVAVKNRKNAAKNLLALEESQNAILQLRMY